MRAQPAPAPPDALPPSCRRDATTTRICPRCNGSGTIVEIDPAALIAAIADAAKGRAFTAVEMIAAADDDEELAAALAGRSARKLGKALQKIAGQDLAGLRVDKIGAERDGTIWLVASVGHTRRVPF